MFEIIYFLLRIIFLDLSNGVGKISLQYLKHNLAIIPAALGRCQKLCEIKKKIAKGTSEHKINKFLCFYIRKMIKRLIRYSNRQWEDRPRTNLFLTDSSFGEKVSV